MCRVLGVSGTGFHNWERRAPSDGGAERRVADREDPADPRRQPRRVWAPEGPPRARARARDPGRTQARRSVDESRRYRRRQAEKAVEDDDPDPRDYPGQRPRRARLQSDGAECAAGRRHHLPAHRRGGRLDLAAVHMDMDSRRIVGWSMATHMRSSLVIDALKMALARRRPGPGLIRPLRPRRPICVAGVRPDRAPGRDRGLDGLPRRRVRQRGRRDVLRDPQERARQPPAPALHPRDALPATTNNSLCSAVEINRSNNNNQHQQPNPGVTQTGRQCCCSSVPEAVGEDGMASRRESHGCGHRTNPLRAVADERFSSEGRLLHVDVAFVIVASIIRSGALHAGWRLCWRWRAGPAYPSG